MPRIEEKPAQLRENYHFLGESCVQQLILNIRWDCSFNCTVDLEIRSTMKTGEQSDIPKCRQRRPVLITDATHYYSVSKIAKNLWIVCQIHYNFIRDMWLLFIYAPLPLWETANIITIFAHKLFQTCLAGDLKSNWFL